MIDEQILALMSNPKSMDAGLKLLMDTYQERLYWQIKGMNIDHNDAKDVLQNVFVKVYRGIGGFKQKSKLSSWLYRIAANESINHLNASKKLRAVSIDGQEQEVQLAYSESVDGEFVIDKLNKSLLILPEKQKKVFELRYYQEMSYQEISDLLGTSVGALKASYHHAVKKIEHYITNE